MPDQENSSGYHFTEILPAQEIPSSASSYVEAYVTSVEPSRCGPLIQQVNNILPATKDLSHLRRVRRRMDEGQPEEEKPSSSEAIGVDKTASVQSKRRKTSSGSISSSLTLDVLLGSRSLLDQFLGNNDSQQVAVQQVHHMPSKITAELVLAEKLSVPNVHRVKVPGRSAESRAEWEEFHAAWPTIFYPLKTLEHKASQLELAENDKQQMIQGIKLAIADKTDDANIRSTAPGAVIVHGATGKLLSTSGRERRKQESSSNHLWNPLQTSILLAIQGMSRVEREVAAGQGMDSQAFQTGQYLCTGCDLYTTQEPSVFEAMSLVHSRIAHVVVLNSDPPPAPTNWIKGLTESFVHNLPGTNHKFRAFLCHRVTEPQKECIDTRHDNVQQ